MTTNGQPYSDKPCGEPNCDGTLFVYCSEIKGDSRVRHFKCRKCGALPGKQSIPLAHAPPRRRTSFI